MQESVVVNPTVLVDPKAAPDSEQPSPQPSQPPEPPANGGSGPGDNSVAPPTDTSAPARTCANCGAQLDDGQDWCLQCGASVPGSLDGGGPSWRSATIVLAATGALVLGAAAAAYAALTQPSPHTVVPKVITVAKVPTTTPGLATTTPGTATVPGTATPTTPGALGTPTTIKPLPGTSTPPKIPLTAPTPKSSGTTTTPSSGTGNTNTGSGESGTGKSTPKSGGTTTPEQTPILLDTNAASTYNPYGYPASNFGDPSLAIDGESATGWTAQVNPAVAPKMAEGIALDLKTGQRVGALKLISSTPGMTVQVYGANGNTLPASITDPAWTALSPSLQAKKRTTHVKLRDSAKAFRFITLWISQAPASAVGTPQAPGHVSVNELELFAAE
jgi:hypothetical protein